ncbi:MAG TPA: pitrilysin family protein [Myxococcota bacterium]|jgi:zinc protease
MREPRPRKRPARLVTGLLALAFFARAAGADPGIEDPAARVRKTVLENGLTVLTLEDRATPVVSLQIWVRVGSRDEARYTGLAHLFEHMMFKGSKHVGSEEHARLIQARGGEVNAYTSNDFTVYFEDVTPETLPLAIALEGERIANLDISQETLDSERQVVLEERRLRTEDDPEGRAFEALMALAFTAHPYRTPVIGWRSDVEAATVEICRQFFDTYYVPNNLWIAVVGDFDTEQTLAEIRRAFGGLRVVEPIPRNPTREPEQRGERRQIVHMDVRGPLLAGAWHAPASGHPDAEALDVASQILSGGRSSRLYRRLVYDAQKALAAEGGYWELADAGIFYAFASVRPDAKIEDVERLFLAEIARLREHPVSAAELDKAKRQLEVSLVNGLTTNHALASRIARETLSFGRVRPLEERLAAIARVTADDVKRVARTYLVDDQRSLVHVVKPPPDTKGRKS